MSDDMGDVGAFKKPKIPKKVMAAIGELLFDAGFDVGDDAFNYWNNDGDVRTMSKILHLIEGNPGLITDLVNSPQFIQALTTRLHDYMEAFDEVMAEYESDE